MDKFDIEVQEGKIGLVVEDERLKAVWKKIDSAKSQYERVKNLQEKHPEYSAEEIISKGVRRYHGRVAVRVAVLRGNGGFVAA